MKSERCTAQNVNMYGENIIKKKERENKMNEKTKLQECFVKSKASGYILNCPCGNSRIGNVLCDIDPKFDDVLRVDYNFLPFEDNTFDTVVQDPPWKISFYKRMKPFFECVRVCKVGGNIIYNAYWVPQSKYVKLKEVYLRQDGQFTNASIISIFEKIKDIPRKV